MTQATAHEIGRAGGAHRASRATPFWMPPPEGVSAIFRDWKHTEQELDALFRSDPSFRSVIEPLAARSVPYARDLAHVKRFTERWRSDQKFREALLSDPRGIAARYQLTIDPEELRPFWDDDAARLVRQDSTWTPSLLVQRHRVFVREKLLHREKLRTQECVPADRRHRLWRERQVKRGLGHLGPRHYQGIVHAPFAIELSDGCSVGCWFCGVSAQRKGADVRYTSENAQLWREVLGVLRHIVGPAAATGFCYWATDPLDNPDYERFCADFADICGRFPQTTTALPHKNVPRVKALLHLSQERGCTINRFSVLSLAIFNRVMEAYTAEELLHCEIVLHNPEAKQMPSGAGRARGTEKLRRLAKARGVREDWEYSPGTIACISGFLFNMVHRRVRLITPCPSSDRWPDGYWSLEEGHFADAGDLEGLLEGMMERQMRTCLRATDPVRFRPDLSIEPLEGGIAVRGRGARTTFTGPPFMRELGLAIARGDRLAGELAVEFEDTFGRPAPLTMNALNQVFDSGVLDEEPPSARPGS